MERLQRLLRLARLRGDRVAIAILETRLYGVKWTPKGIYETTLTIGTETYRWRSTWTEAELREAWGK
jgi:hypothetical protein